MKLYETKVILHYAINGCAFGVWVHGDRVIHLVWVLYAEEAPRPTPRSDYDAHRALGKEQTCASRLIIWDISSRNSRWRSMPVP